jgi:predicted DNA-binding transcriptional regulator YafY
LNTPQLQWWLLSQCAGLEVIAPVDLRERIADQLNKAADRYRN